MMKKFGSIATVVMFATTVLVVGGSPASATEAAGRCVTEYRWTGGFSTHSEIFRIARNSSCQDLNARWATQNTPEVLVRGQYLNGGRWYAGSMGYRKVRSNKFPGHKPMRTLILSVKDGTKVRGQVRPQSGYDDQEVNYAH